MSDEQATKPQHHELCVRGLTGSERDRDLELVLGHYKRSVAARRWDGAKAILSFTNRDDAEQFVAGNNGRPFKRTTIYVEWLSPLPAAPPAARVPSDGTPMPGITAEKARSAMTAKRINTKPGQPGQDRRRPAPYHFVPVQTSVMPAAPPVLHDRLDEGHWSGELHLTLRALTPLLAANDQHDFAAAVEIGFHVPKHDSFPNSDRLVLRQIPNDKLELVSFGRMTSQEQRQYRALAGQLGLTQPDARRNWEHKIDELFKASQRINDRAAAAYQGLVARRSRAARSGRQHPPGNAPPPQREVAPDKKLLAPLTLPGPDASHPGAVLINGAALKGMLRHSLAALLSAPLERVEERSFSYRPNLQTVVGREKPSRETMPALVVGGGGWSDKDGSRANPVDLLPLENLRDVCYVHPVAETDSTFPARITALLRQTALQRQKHYATPAARNALRLTSAEASRMAKSLRLTQGNILKGDGPGSPTVLDGWLPIVNLNGVDLAGQLNRRFHAKNPELARELATKSPEGYRLLFANLPANTAVETLAGNDPVLLSFYESISHLADAVAGHLRDHPLLNGREEIQRISQELNEFRRRGLLPGDLVFLECETHGSKNHNHAVIATLGHQFYYRQRYRDTLHHSRERDYQSRDQHPKPQTLRDILCPRELEQLADAGNQGAPLALTAARLLCGYVGTRDGKYRATEPLTFGIGTADGKKTDFSQLAGRLAFNHAVEMIEDPKTGKPKTPAERFLNDDDACLVPLRPLGSPKPSAVEHYLTQDLTRLGRRLDDGILCTYGDTPGDPSAGDLRGRKFYLHQADAARLAEGYNHCFELGVDDPDPAFWNSGPQNRPADLPPRRADWRRAEDLEMLRSAQAAIGHFVSRPGSRFQCTLRFVNLRAWELGAVLLTLAPTAARLRVLAGCLGAAGRPVLDWLRDAEAKHAPDDSADPPRPLLAHKLGHGRPLGLGSVVVDVDACLRLTGVRPVSEAATPEIELRGVGMAPAESDSGAVTAVPATQNIPEWEQSALNELATMLQKAFANRLEPWVEHALLPCLRVHRYAGTTRLDYPRDLPRKPKDNKPDFRGDETVFSYHTNLRQKHARQRKLPANPTNRRDRFGLSDAP